MKKTTEAKDIFDIIDLFFSNHDIQSCKLLSVSTDDAAVMIGNKYGPVALMNKRKNRQLLLASTALFTDNINLFQLHTENIARP